MLNKTKVVVIAMENKHTHDCKPPDVITQAIHIRSQLNRMNKNRLIVFVVKAGNEHSQAPVVVFPPEEIP